MAALVFRVACKFLPFKVDWTYGASGSVCPGRLLGFNWPVRKRVRLGTESFLKTENLISGVNVEAWLGGGARDGTGSPHTHIHRFMWDFRGATGPPAA